jgi:SAM-dependent methyltransferase
MYANLEDLAFGVANGPWTMFRCIDCRGAYLNPRPTPNSIGRAYSRYYTHTRSLADLPSSWSGLKGALSRAYLNSKYGYKLSPAIPKSASVFRRLFPRKAAHLDFLVRHTPAPYGASHLLDVGCGNGEFLRIAIELGFAAMGIEPDPKAAEAARHGGLKVLQGILPNSEIGAHQFDHITLNSVIEHLHEPRAALEQAYSLLKPGGRIWLTQPI